MSWGYRRIRTMLVLAISLGAVVVAAAGAVAGANPFGNVVDEPFASIATGPQGVIVVPEAIPSPLTPLPQGEGNHVRSMAVRSAVASQHSPLALQKAQVTLDRMQRHGLVSPRAEVRFPRTVVHLQNNRMVLPDLEAAIVRGQGIGAPTNDIEFVFEGFSSHNEAALRSYLEGAMPKARMIYGAPAFDITVKVIQDDTLHNLQGGTYDVTTNELRIPPLSGNFPEDTYVLIMLVLNAFHDDAILFYDAWEQGFIGAAAYAVQTTPGVSPGYDPIDPGPFYCLSVYEPENSPELANPTYYPASGTTNMLVWRIAMARAAWLKCYIEDEYFFANFNRAYYAALTVETQAGSPSYAMGDAAGVGLGQESFDANLPGDVPALKVLAAGVLPQVEGQSFFAWFKGQYVLDTSVHLGPKLYVWNIPLEISVALIAELYTTLPGGDEEPMGDQGRTTYWSYDFAVKLYAEEGNIIDIPSGGQSAGEGFLLPTFYNIGGAQLISVDVEAGNLCQRYPYPYQQRGFEAGENNLYGGIIGAAEGTISVTGGDGINGLEVKRGVWGDRITAADLSPMQLEVRFQNQLGQTMTRKYNVGWDSYAVFLRGAEQTRVSHTFLKGTTGLHMMSLPVWPVSNSAPDILGIAAQRLLLAEWDPTLEGEDKYTIWPDVRPFVPGRGFWLKVFENTNMQTFGVLPAGDDATRVYLPIGWNIIGSPRLEPVKVEDLTVQFGEQEPATFAQAVDNGWVQQGVFGYDQQAGYDTVEELETFAGYWLRVLRSPGLYVEFPVAGTAAVGSSAAAEAGLTWKLPLVVKAGSLHSTAAYLGVAGQATDRVDTGLDIAAPPDFGPCVKVRFVQPQSATAGPVYMTDVRGDVRPQRWELQASSSLPDTEIRLSWPDLSGLPNEVRPVLIDRDTGRRQYMRTTSQFCFRTGSSGGARNLAIEIDEQTADLLAMSCVDAVQTGAGVVVTYTLSKPAAVSLRVLNIAGRTVATVSYDEVRSAGTCNAVWNMRNAGGSLVPTGTYLIQLSARAEDGQQINTLRTMQLQR